MSEAGCRRSVPVSPPGPLGPLGSHFPPFAPLHDPTQALQLRSAGRGDALGRKRGRRKGPLQSRSAVHWGRDPAQNFSGFDFRTRARKVVAEPEEEAGARCPEGLWPLPPQVSPRVTYARRSRWQVSTRREPSSGNASSLQAFPSFSALQLHSPPLPSGRDGVLSPSTGSRGPPRRAAVSGTLWSRSLPVGRRLQGEL